MQQVARNLTDAVDGFLLKHPYIILDRDPLYTHAFRQMLRVSAVTSVKLPPRSPNLLPDMNGVETARIIHTREGCKHIPIIFLTGYSFDELDTGDTTELGAIEFLMRPVPPDMLRAKVATLLNFVAW